MSSHIPARAVLSKGPVSGETLACEGMIGVCRIDKCGGPEMRLFLNCWRLAAALVISASSGCHTCGKPKSPCCDPSPGVSSPPVPAASSYLVPGRPLPPSNTYIVPPRDLARLPAGPGVSDAPGVRLAVPNSDDGGEQVRQTTQLDRRESKEPPKAANEATGPNALKEAPSAPTSIPQFAIAKSRPRIA